MDNIRVLATDLRFPEGPEFDGDGNLWCVEQEGEGLFCRMANGDTKRIHTGGRPNGLICHLGHIWFCDSGQNSVRRVNVATQSIETVDCVATFTRLTEFCQAGKCSYAVN